MYHAAEMANGKYFQPTIGACAELERGRPSTTLPVMRPSVQQS